MKNFVCLSVFMCLCVLTQVFCEDTEPKEGLEFWTSRNQIQDPAGDWLSRDPFREILLRMTRKPRPHQFIGLMGKRSEANAAQITCKRHKVNSFVDVMGKRSHEDPESYEWRMIPTYDDRR
ncbi:protachykinin-1 [Nematolebias whitei]|uniref:protachykinin-1 n=1 Tax=Nematolebias whitei TaxID=451745 RepID=UPI001898AE44|nr:protachykinin-1 [Nematolebias whitei]XP_037548829.1 protachykinin-1 [Nematolebias whitei]